MKTKLISAILSVAVIAGLMLVPATLPGVPAGMALAASNVTIEVLPSTTVVVPGGTFNVTVQVQNPDAMDIYGCQAKLDFDSSYFNVTGITGGTIFTYVLKNEFSNPNGTIDYDAAMATPPGTPTNATSILIATISCQALASEGVSTIDFAWQTMPPRKTMVSLGAYDYLGGDMSLMHSGAVIVGTPKFTVNVTPWAYPGLAMGGIGIGYNITWDSGVPIDWDFMAIAPTDPLPNTTSWNWGEVIIPTAVDFVPGWAFVGWTPVIGTVLPPDTLEYPEGSGHMVNIYPMVVVNDALSKTTTANFAPLGPAIGVAPTSLYFETFEGTNPADDYLILWNSGGGMLSWSITDDDVGGWLNEDPISGTLNTSVTVENQTVTVSVDVTGLPAGDYSANITITGASSEIVPVTMKVKPATAVDNFRDIIASTDSGKPGETTELYAGETFDVYVNFTAPPTSPNNGFNAIGLTDVAPDGWTVTVDKTWCWINGTPASALKVNALGNKAEIMLAGPYGEGTTISLMYKVTVPTTATPGLNNWPKCGNPDAGDAWLEYYFNEDGPYTNCISDDWQVTVTQPGDLVGETREVNSALLADVDVQLYLVGPGYLWSDISTPLYVDTAWVTGTYWLVTNKTRWYNINITDGVMLPGKAFTIDLTTPALLAAGNVFDFEGDYGLIPRAPTMAYALRSVNLWKFHPALNPEWGLSDWKAMDVCNAWLYPS